MGLTRVRAEQISNIDYKQAVRVISTANVGLSGSAPSQVDGVNLSLNDRILVAGQTTSSQNGLYYVSVVGSGANGTWLRTSDANTTGEINAGMIVMVTEGVSWGDTSWKLVTNDPITIGTTELTFLQNTGNSFNIISANGTSILANGVSSTVNFNSGNNLVITGNALADSITFAISDNPSFVGNVTGNYFIGNGSQLTGISVSTSIISNGSSNVNIPLANGNVTVSADGIPNVAIFAQGTMILQGAVANPKTTTDNIIVANNVNAMLIGPVIIGSAQQVIIPDDSTVYIYG